MQMSHATPPPVRLGNSLGRNLGWFLVVPVSVTVLLSLVLALAVMGYQGRHANRIFTGVTVWGRDLSGLSREEATAALARAFPYPQEPVIVFVDPATGQEWRRAPADLGLAFATEATLDAALGIGRSGGPLARLREQFEVWYYGRAVAPIVLFDEGQLDRAIAALAEEIDRPAVDAELAYDGTQIDYRTAQTGRSLNRADTRERLLSPIADLREVRIELRIDRLAPQVQDTQAAARAIEALIGSPMSLYLPTPLADDDLGRIELSVAQLTEWLRIRPVTGADGSLTYDVFLDENGARAWLRRYADKLYRPPERARFYFDDATRELVLVEPHINGRALNVEATASQLALQATTTNRSVPLIVEAIVPDVNAESRAADLGITELLQEQTTFFYGSSPERKHNIARAAANFYGIVVGPGEEFSFNKFLGDVSREEGYETGLIILGGRTIEGVGGGVCQVSTTVYQAAFWSGFPILERQEHGYRVGYYDDGEGPGMDATIFSPLVDFRFLNNTPYYLLIENYYNEVSQSLTFKFYSTSLGRQVEKEGPFFENIRPPNPDAWEFNPELQSGEIKQVDWAVEGARVTVNRTVLNAQGDLLELDTIVSNYIPWQNVYQFGPDTDLPPGANVIGTVGGAGND